MTTTLYPLTHHSADGGTEEWLADVTVDCGTADAIEAVVALSACVRGSGTFRLRLGGTAGGIDGHEVATIAGSGSSSWADAADWATRVVMRGQALLKLTGSATVAGSAVEVNAGTVAVTYSASVVPPLQEPGPLTEQLGCDIWMDPTTDNGVPNFSVTPAQDYLLVRDLEAVQMSLLRRFLANPGEWKTKPEYGAGLRAAVRGRGRQIDVDKLKTQLREQALSDSRVAAVDAVTAVWDGNLITYSLTIRLVADENNPLSVTGQLSGRI